MTSPKKKKTNFDRQFQICNSSDDQDDTVSFYVARWAIFRLLGLVYWVAFVGAWNQTLGLIGSQGLQPAEQHWSQLQAESPWAGFLQRPSIFWWIPLNDSALEGVAMAGVVISTGIVTGWYVSWLSWALLWLLQFTLITTFQHTAFYQYGWESQLLETTVLALFLCDLPRMENWRINLALRPTFQTPPSPIVLWLFRWLCFRISMGAGLIKRRGSSCWTDRTCLWYHFETQPLPSPLSFLFHFLPHSLLSRAVDLDMAVQFYTSPMVLLVGNKPIIRLILRTAGMIQAGFMVNILLSGNFSFLNHLTIVPALACLDDACYPIWLQEWIVPAAYAADTAKYAERFLQPRSFPPRWMVDSTFFILIAYLSTPVVTNLLQIGDSRQLMNASFDRFRLVNTYGAFGSVGKQRFEPIVSVSADGKEWIELEFPCKPGRLTRRPCFCAPYHYRLDWNLWFLGFEPHNGMLQRRETWLYNLLEKVLSNTGEEPWHELLDSSSVEYLKDAKLRYAKVDMYHYQMAAPLGEILQDYWQGNGEVHWWKRSYKEPLINPIAWNSNDGLVWAELF